MYEINGIPVDRVHDVMGALVQLKDSANPDREALEILVGRAIDSMESHEKSGQPGQAKAFSEVIEGAIGVAKPLYGSEYRGSEMATLEMIYNAAKYISNS